MRYARHMQRTFVIGLLMSFVLACSSSPAHRRSSSKRPDVLALAQLELVYRSHLLRLSPDGQVTLDGAHVATLAADGTVRVDGRIEGQLGADGWYRTPDGEKRFRLDHDALEWGGKRLTLAADGTVVGGSLDRFAVRGAIDTATRRTALLGIGVMLELEVDALRIERALRTYRECVRSPETPDRCHDF